MTKLQMHAVLCIVSVQHWHKLTSTLVLKSFEYRHKNNSNITGTDPFPFYPSVVVALLYREDTLEKVPPVVLIGVIESDSYVIRQMGMHVRPSGTTCC